MISDVSPKEVVRLTKYTVDAVLVTDAALKRMERPLHDCLREEDYQNVHEHFDSLEEAIATVSPAYINEKAWPFSDTLLWAHLENGKLTALEFSTDMADEKRLRIAREEKAVSPNLLYLAIYEQGNQNFQRLRMSTAPEPEDDGIPF